MTQVGYLENLNPWTNGEETLDETDDVMETGGSSAFAYANNKLDAGEGITCAITDNGSLKCWGWDNWGMLGDGGSGSTYTNLGAPPATAIDLGTGRTAVEVSASERHVCAILDNGSLKCWGSGSEGHLGIGTNPTAQHTPAWVDLGTGRTAISVATGRFHTCAVLDNGDVKCWGYSGNGQLGMGAGSTAATNAPPTTPVNLGTGRTAVAISSSWYTTCAILDNGDLKCWGSDNYGQLGDGGTNTNQFSPVSVNLGTGRTAIAVAALREYTCAILDDGSIKCWGLDGSGQLGNGNSLNNQNSPPSTPVDLGTGRTAVAIDGG